MPTPRPVRNAVSFEDRVAIRLNRAGTSFSNPIVATNRNSLGATTGINIRLEWPIVSSDDRVRSAQFASFDNNNNFVESTSFLAQVQYDFDRLVAYADLVAGEHIPSSATGRRNELVVQTTFNVTISQDIYLRDAAADIVVFDGIVTTATDPLQIEMSEISPLGLFSQTWPVSFFPSWNDEVGRQHGENVTSLTGNIEKPYGGAATVEVYRGGVLLLSERPVSELTTMTHTPTADGETVAYEFRFRSDAGSADYVVGEGYVQFFECAAGTPTTDDIPPVLGFPDSGLPPIDVPILVGDVTGWDPTTQQIDVDLDRLGRAAGQGVDNTTGTIRLHGFGGGVRDSAGVALAIPTPLATHTVAVTDTDVGTTLNIALPAGFANARMVIVTAETASGVAGQFSKANPLIYRANDVDVVNLPTPPVIENSPAPTFNFTTRELTFTVSNYGFGNDVDLLVTAKPVYAEAASNHEQPQTFADLGVDLQTFAPITTILPSSGTGAKSVTLNFADNNLQGLVVTFANNYGVSPVRLYFDRGIVDTDKIKAGPQVSGLSLSTTTNTNDTLNFTLDDDGGSDGNLRYSYTIVDSAGDTVTFTDDTGSGAVSSGTGARSIVVQTGHHDIDGLYLLTVWNGQGAQRAAPLTVDHFGTGVRTING